MDEKKLKISSRIWFNLYFKKLKWDTDTKTKYIECFNNIFDYPILRYDVKDLWLFYNKIIFEEFIVTFNISETLFQSLLTDWFGTKYGYNVLAISIMNEKRRMD